MKSNRGLHKNYVLQFYRKSKGERDLGFTKKDQVYMYVYGVHDVNYTTTLQDCIHGLHLRDLRYEKKYFFSSVKFWFREFCFIHNQFSVWNLNFRFPTPNSGFNFKLYFSRKFCSKLWLKQELVGSCDLFIRLPLYPSIPWFLEALKLTTPIVLETIKTWDGKEKTKKSHETMIVWYNLYPIFTSYFGALDEIYWKFEINSI